MTHYRFDWAIFATDALLSRLLAAAGASSVGAAERDLLRPLAARIFAAIGGPPVSARQYSQAQRTAIAERLMRDAAGCALAASRVAAIPGMDIEAQASAPPRVTAQPRIALNIASQAEIESLPGIGPALASRIIAARIDRPLRGLTDLADRVDGIGPALAERLRYRVTFALPALTLGVATPSDLDHDFAVLANHQTATAAVDRAQGALQVVLAQVLATPTPAPPVLFATPSADATATLAADSIDVLAGSTYYAKLRELLAAASQRVDVCMFHIAMPAPNHPTKRLLEALVAARDRGVTVRVLVDRDRDEDPYRSTVINEIAVGWLRDAGVNVREDASDKLLHSKFVLIDADLTVIGSHNWTAGSYFVYDDLSLAIRGAATTSAQRARFNALWSAGT
jgi:DNA uptake protein ComE-like DNA-binding protein